MPVKTLTPPAPPLRSKQIAHNPTSHNTPPVPPDWWQTAVIYQVYPRSYADSNGDGIGDLPGIIEKLPYIANLGADAVWISPFFTSPMKDFGYDVSDYKGVAPMFGTLDDFKHLIKIARKYGLKVLIDQVYSHTSAQHPWFIASKADKTNEYANWYVWADAQADGTPPNNWQSIFGGNAWHWHSGREQYYFHNFLREQPDLNFHHPQVQAAILDVARFWLDLGVNGFRLDTVNLYFHDKKLRSNPPLPTNDAKSKLKRYGIQFNPYHFQHHLYDKSQPENIAFLQKLRQLMNQYDAVMSVGEIGDDESGIELIKEYTQDTNRLHTCYSFDFLNNNFSPAFFRSTLERFEEMRRPKQTASTTSTPKNSPQNLPPAHPHQSWACWAFSNHDATRAYSRWFLQTLPASKRKQYLSAPNDMTTLNALARQIDPENNFAKLLIALLGSLWGPICIYQGEELGLPQAEIAFADFQDPYGIYFYPKYKGRDGCRTPMPWSDQLPQAGFSTAKRTWLPIPKEALPLAVNRQLKNTASVLNFTQRFLKFRRTTPSLLYGTFHVSNATSTYFALERKLNQHQTLHAYFNFTSQPLTIPLPPPLHQPTLSFANLANFANRTPQKATHSPALALKSYGFAFLQAK